MDQQQLLDTIIEIKQLALFADGNSDQSEDGLGKIIAICKQIEIDHKIEGGLAKENKTATEKALKTWYHIDDPLHFDPLHPAIGLAGEAGKLLDLYKKERFKEGVSWWDCVRYNKDKDIDYHFGGSPKYCSVDGTIYTAKVLDKLGDLWLYLRILGYQAEFEFTIYLDEDNTQDDILEVLTSIYTFSGKILSISISSKINTFLLNSIFNFLINALRLLDCTLDQLTEINWNKLKGGDNHGLQSTRESQ